MRKFLVFILAFTLVSASCGSGGSENVGTTGANQSDLSDTADDRQTGSSGTEDDSQTGSSGTGDETVTDSSDGTGTTDAGGTVTNAGNDEDVIDLDDEDIELTSLLIRFDECDSLLDYLRTEYSERVGPWGFQERPWFGPVTDTEGARFSNDLAEPAFEDPVAAESGANDDDSGGYSDYSGTNVQELGVDEADIVKTDGSRIFVVSKGRLAVVDVATRSITGSLDLGDAFATELFISGNSVLVIQRTFSDDFETDQDHSPQGGSSITAIRRIDVRDGEPEMVSTMMVEGGYVTSRSIDGVARVVLRLDPQWTFPFVYPQGQSAHDTAQEANRLAVLNSTLADWLPGYTLDDGTWQQLPACENVHAPSLFSGIGLTTVLSLPVDGPITPDTATSVLAPGDVVYASATSLYTATVAWNPVPIPRPIPVPLPVEPLIEIDPPPLPADTPATEEAVETPAAEEPPAEIEPTLSVEAPAAEEPPPEVEPTLPVEPPVEPVPEPEPSENVTRTSIHRFDISGAAEAVYMSSGDVAGMIRNQFSFSEHNGYLRVVTTNDWWGPTSESYVRVLQEQGDRLVEVGQVGNIGRDEQVQSVRFVGDVGYVVTFRQIDPFYTIDLSEPTQPVIRGELKIPGFSSYLHPISDDFVLGVGSDATDEGRVTGAKVSLFDVSDLDNPLEVAVWSAPDGWNNVGWDHRAFLWWEPESLAIIPVKLGFSDWAGAVVLNVTDSTITETGRINHLGTDDEPPDTDCRQLTESDLPSTDRASATTDIEYYIFEGYAAVVVCEPGEIGLHKHDCYRLEQWQVDQAAELIDSLEISENATMMICWPDTGIAEIVRSIVIGSELWTVSYLWGDISGTQSARLQVNELGTLQRLEVVGLDG